MKPEIDQRHREEVAQAYVATERVRLAAKVSVGIGIVGLIWELGAMIFGSQEASDGVVILVGLALATVVPAAGLYAASFRTSLGAARLERALEDD
jgi:hypothetical protein